MLLLLEQNAREMRIHDDMQEIIERILQADVVIWSFPLYYFGLPGPLKNLIDRSFPCRSPS